MDYAKEEADMQREASPTLHRLTVGLVGLGLDAYWEQFEGLQKRLQGYLSVVEQKISSPSRRIINLGLLDSPMKATEVGRACRAENVDLLLVYVTTYGLSATILPVIRRAGVPVVLLNLQPAAAIEYARFNRLRSRTERTGEWLAYCSSCSVPELANVLTRLGVAFHQVTGILHDDPACWCQLEEWIRGAEVMNTLTQTRLGLMGHYYSGMLDVATDLVQVTGCFGVHIEMLEVDELSADRRDVSDAEIGRRLGDFRRVFEVSPECSEAELRRAARTSVALDCLVARYGLGMLAYYYRGKGVAENEDTMSSIILGTSLLTSRGIAVAGEYEVKNVIAMKILDLLGAGGSFTEFYAIDFNADLVLMGHDGPGHSTIAEGRVQVNPLQVYHGKVGSGLSVEMSVRLGLVTLLSVVEDPTQGFKFLVAQGESVRGETLQIGNTNSFYRFPLSATHFVEAWNAHNPAHHCAIGTGHLAERLTKLGKLLGIAVVQVC